MITSSIKKTSTQSTLDRFHQVSSIRIVLRMLVKHRNRQLLEWGSCCHRVIWMRGKTLSICKTRREKFSVKNWANWRVLWCDIGNPLLTGRPLELHKSFNHAACTKIMEIDIMWLISLPRALYEGNDFPFMNVDLNVDFSNCSATKKSSFSTGIRCFCCLDGIVFHNSK